MSLKHSFSRVASKITNHSSIKIREATTADLSDMSKLLVELFSIEVDFTPDIKIQRQGLAALMKSTDATILVAEHKSGIVGMCTMQSLISTAEGGVVGMVEDMVVDQRWRAKGVGSLLISEIESVAKQKKMSRIQLLTELDNIPASKLYGKHHWEITHMNAMRKLLN